MAWRGSFSRSLLATARSSSLRSPPASLPRVRPPSLAWPRLQPRLSSFAPPRSFAELGCTHSFLPIITSTAAPCLTSHLSVCARACCELSQGTFCRTCQDR